MPCLIDRAEVTFECELQHSLSFPPVRRFGGAARQGRKCFSGVTIDDLVHDGFPSVIKRFLEVYRLG